MKLRLNLFGPRSQQDRHWPGYLFGGRLRTSTLLLIVAFLALWWVYDTYRPPPPPAPLPTQVAPPGFVPDPNYTWVPRSKVQEPPWTPTHTPHTPQPPPITTAPTPPSVSPVPAPAPPPFVLPTPPCLLPPQFCPPPAGPSPAPAPPPLPGPPAPPPPG